MSAPSDDDLYARGAGTLVASFREYARGSAGAAVRCHPGVAAAVFPNGPERAFYNNALLERGMAAGGRVGALDAMEAAYAGAGVDRFAAWVHETDGAMRRDLERRGYTLDAATRAMGMALDRLRRSPPRVDLGPPDWLEHLRLLGAPPGHLAGADPGAFRVLVARLDGEAVATAMALDADGDCGIYNVTTAPHARRRGLGTALTLLHAQEAFARGCRTASLQSTEMAERLYAAVGFRDLGRFLEYVPPPAPQPGRRATRIATAAGVSTASPSRAETASTCSAMAARTSACCSAFSRLAKRPASGPPRTAVSTASSTESNRIGSSTSSSWTTSRPASASIRDSTRGSP
jgi:ribosomal protein S18 acetylase RimI-like enzyme